MSDAQATASNAGSEGARKTDVATESDADEEASAVPWLLKLEFPEKKQQRLLCL